MKAIAVHPGKPNSMHLEDVPEPHVSEIPDGRGVLVRVLRVGVDGTDKEINAAEYGAAPEGADFLIIGHENFGVVEEVGANVPDTIRPGGYVVASVRRPGSSIYGQIGLQDFTTDDVYYERGINLLHGYLTEYYVEDHQFVFPLPATLREVGVLLEPTTVAEKGVNHAYEIQRRVKGGGPPRGGSPRSGTAGAPPAGAAPRRAPAAVEGVGAAAGVHPRLRHRRAPDGVRGAASRPRADGLLAAPEAQPERGADRAARRALRLVAGRDARRRKRRPRAVRPDVRRHRVQPDRVGGRRGARQERRARARLDHGRRPEGRDQLGQDQPELRARQQGDGGNRQRLAARLPHGHRRPDQGRGDLPRLAGAAADDA